jgi:spore maturation protein CgeB
MERDEARRDRIAKLERDRDVLRRRLEEAKQGRFSRRNPTEATPEPTPPPPPALEVPGVGIIREGEIRPLKEPRDLRVATIVDGFTATVLDPEFRAYPISALSWEADLEAAHPELLFVESAYRGVDGSWATRVARFGDPSSHLQAVVDWCRRRQVPTVFWNKEDPINFDWFVESARLFEFVFTVDGDMIPRYREVLGHDRVHLLQFFAQPAIHYPGPEEQRTGTVAFAGSYYAAKHPERREQMEMLLEPAREFGLHIFDRHGGTDDARFAWPEEYRPHIVGSLNYLQTVEAYRRYKVFLNVNTVTDSPTMCARRVFELAASGTPIVSGPSRALNQLDRTERVRIVATTAEAASALESLLDGSEIRRAMTHEARDWVTDGNTASDRVDEVLNLTRPR